MRDMQQLAVSVSRDELQCVIHARIPDTVKRL